MTTTTAPPTTTELDNQADGAITADATAQQLSLLPQIDGKTRTRLRLSLSGTVELEVTDERDADLARRLQIGSTVPLEIVGTGIRFEVGADSKADKIRRSNDGYIEDVVHTIALRTLSIEYPLSEADRAKAQGQ